ncbi:MAG: ribosome maturation factor RimP [Acidimicrobiia bacterium]
MGALPTFLLCERNVVRVMESQVLRAVWDAVEPYLAAERLELDDLELIGRGRARTLRVVIDSETEKVDLNRISEVSRGLSRLLDNLEEGSDLAGPYQLEVTSPGLERMLTRPRHFQKSLGREVIVKTEAGTRRGSLTRVGEDDLTVTTDQGPVSIVLSEVVSARTVFIWEKPAKPGQKARSSS